MWMPQLRLQHGSRSVSYEWKPFRDASSNWSLRRGGLRKLGSMSLKDALAYKRMVGSRIRWSQDALDEPVNGALGEVYGSVRIGLDRAVPGLSKLNKSYANLVSAKSAIERRAPIAERQSHVGLFDLALGVSGHVPLLIAKRVAEMPLTKTAVSQGVCRMPPAVPEMPLRRSVPLVGAMQAQQNRQRPKTLRELKAEAARRRPEGAAAAP